MTQLELTLTAEGICQEAARLVGGPRQATHGDKTVNFKNICALWNAWLDIRCRTDDGFFGFTAGDVAELMELFKIARRHSGDFNPDDYIDAAGYAGCAAQIRTETRPTNPGEPHYGC